MSRAGWRRWATLALLGVLGMASLGTAQEPAPVPHRVQYPNCPPPVPIAPPDPTPCDRPLPINLPTALHLAGVRPLDVALASERIRVAAAELERAEVLWLPTV